jgi:hypothetical protein
MAAGLCVFGLALGVRADEKKGGNNEKIGGSWELSKSDTSFSAMYDFAKDGKIREHRRTTSYVNEGQRERMI